jgi:hypothetical protein
MARNFVPHDVLLDLEEARAQIDRKDLRAAHSFLKKTIGNMDNPSIYKCLSRISNRPGFYLARKQFLFPGVE